MITNLENLINEFQQKYNLNEFEKTVEICNQLLKSDFSCFAGHDDKIDNASIVFSQILVSSIKNFNSDVFTHCIELFSYFHSQFADFVCTWGNINNFFRISDYFTLLFFIENELVDNTDMYVIYIENIKKLILSDKIKIWYRNEENRVFIEQQMNILIYNMIYFSKNKRADCLFALLELLIVINNRIKAETEIEKLVLPIFKVLSNSYIMKKNSSLERLKKIKNENLFENDAIINGLDSIYFSQKTEKKFIPRELTTDSVFKIAFDEVFGDMKVSFEEQKILQKLRQFIRISPLHYQNLFTSAAKNKEKVLNRDFSKEQFLYKAALIAFEDGVLTVQEKRILKAICTALEMEGETVKKIVLSAKKEAISKYQQNNSSKENDLKAVFNFNIAHYANDFSRFTNSVEKEQKANSIFSSKSKYILSSTYNIVKTIFSDTNSFLKKVSDTDSYICGIEKLKENSERKKVVDFIWDSEIYPLPAIIIYTNTKSVTEMLTKFKGNKVCVSFSENISKELVKAPEMRNQYTADVIFQNLATDCTFRFDGVSIFNNVQNFIDGTLDSNGNFEIIFYDYEVGSTFNIIDVKGGFDYTGFGEKARILFNNGEISQSIEYLEKLKDSVKDLLFINHKIGNCYEKMYYSTKDSNLLNKARDYYEEELKLDNNSFLALNDIGRILFAEEHYSEAIEYFKKAIKINDFFIPALCRLAYAYSKKETLVGKPKPEILYYILEYFCKAYHIDPENKYVKNIMNEMSDFFDIDFENYFKLMPVDTKYQ